jgi:hypothetical protein
MRERKAEVELRNGRVFVADVMLVQDGRWLRIMDDKAHAYEAELIPSDRVSGIRFDYEDVKTSEEL